MFSRKILLVAIRSGFYALDFYKVLLRKKMAKHKKKKKRAFNLEIDKTSKTLMEPQIYASSKKLLCLGERLIFLYRGPKTKENNILEVDVILNDSILNTSYSIKDYQKK